jgi:hypothetical protein
MPEPTYTLNECLIGVLEWGMVALAFVACCIWIYSAWFNVRRGHDEN